MDQEQLSALPPASFGGQFPTLNQRGFMSPSLDEFNQVFVERASASDLLSVDLGCAYGITALAALAAGARVLAIDMEQGHLDVLGRLCPPEDRARLSTRVGLMPGATAPSEPVAAVHTARMLHFLSPSDVVRSLEELHDWLVPGGTLVVTVETPYSPMWASLAGRYEERKAAGEPWAGYIPDITPVFEAMGTRKPPTFVDAMNLMDADILGDACRAAGFEVEDVYAFTRHPTPSGEPDQLGAVATRPL